MNSSIDYMKRPKGATLKTAKKAQKRLFKIILTYCKGRALSCQGEM